MFFTRRGDVFIHAQMATDIAKELGFVEITYGNVIDLVKHYKLGRKNHKGAKWRISRTLWVSFLLYSPAIKEEGITRVKAKQNVLTFTDDDMTFCNRPRLLKRGDSRKMKQKYLKA